MVLALTLSKADALLPDLGNSLPLRRASRDDVVHDQNPLALQRSTDNVVCSSLWRRVRGGPSMVSNRLLVFALFGSSEHCGIIC
jgi:hypothetical protein